MELKFIKIVTKLGDLWSEGNMYKLKVDYLINL